MLLDKIIRLVVSVAAEYFIFFIRLLTKAEKQFIKGSDNVKRTNINNNFNLDLMEEQTQTRGLTPTAAFFSTISISMVLGACYVVHWFPFNVIALFHHLAPGIFFLIAFMLVAIRILLPKYLPRVFRVLALFYYLAVTTYAIMLGFYVAILDWKYIVFCLGFSTGFGIWIVLRPESKPSLFAALAVIYAMLFTTPHAVVKIGGMFLLILVIPGLALGNPRKIGRAALLFASIVALIVLRLGHFYYGGDPALVPRVLSQPGIERVVSIDSTKWSQLRKFGRQIRFAADNAHGTRTIIGGDTGTVVADYKGKSLRKLLTNTSADKLVYGPHGKRLILGEYGNQGIDIVDDENLVVLKRVEAKGHSFSDLWYDKNRNNVLTADDHSTRIGIFSLDTMQFENFIQAKANRDVLVDDRTGTLLAATLRKVYWIDLDTQKAVRTLKAPSSQIRLAVDSDRRLLYVSCFSSGELWKVDVDSGKVLQKTRLERGIRFLKLTQDKKTLFASSYFKGNIFQIKVPAMVVEKTIYAGPRVRSLHIAPGSGKLVFGSSLGAFRYRFDSSE